jgi:A/G-specific adenine glycosylase
MRQAETRSLLSPVLLAWYQQNARDLPWRGHAEPYAVWVSEIMLQQTRVETVIPYFMRWMDRFPTITALRKLPGIGRYTAGAIASIAFGLDEPVLDGNVRRVLSRLFDVIEPAKSLAGEKRLWELAAAHLPAGQAGEFNQALMDLGATICTPRDPACAQCPLAAMCQAFALGTQEQRPVMAAKPSVPQYTVTAGIIEHHGQILITQRPLQGLLGGLWEFPGGKQMPGEDLAACLKREIYEELGVEIVVGRAFGTYRHAYTHFRVTLHAFRCRLANGIQPQALQVNDLRWIGPVDLANYPMGKIDRQIATQLFTAHMVEKSQC